MNHKYLDANYMKFRNKLFTLQEVVKVCERVTEEVKEENTLNNQLVIAMLTATVLNAEPFKFGKKRLTEFFRLFFDQLNYLGNNKEDYELVDKTVKDIGLVFDVRKGKMNLTVE